MTITLGTIAAILSALISIGAILSVAVKAGKFSEVTAQMKREILRAHSRLDAFELVSRAEALAIKEIQGDVKHIMASVEEIKKEIIRHEDKE